ncbi:MAG: outer membrane protein transport protein [bacterium]
MRKTTICALVGTALILSGPHPVLGAGFSIYEAGVRATALGGAFTATADDGSALFYNAAGLSFQDRPSFNLHLMTITPQFKFNGQLAKGGAVETGQSDKKIFPVPGVYYTNNTGNKLAYGVGLYAPFGLGVTWKDGSEWIGRRVSHDVYIETIYVTPAVSYLIADGLALAIGLDVAKQKIDLTKFSPEPTYGTNAIETTIEGHSDFNVTPSFGLMYRPDDKLSLGVMYHHKKTMNYDDGDATLNNAIPVDDPLYSWPANLIAGLGGSEQKLTSELNLPYILSFGLAYRIQERLAAEVNYVRFGWGTFEKLALDFDNDNLDQTIHFNYEDTWQLRFGVDYQLMPGKFNLMAGYVRDNTPQPLAAVSPILPDSDRNDYSFGAQYRSGAWDFGFTYMVVVGDERTNVENGEPVRNTTDYPFGTYKSLANIFGLSCGYNF